jgi:hypothetical protein
MAWERRGYQHFYYKSRRVNGRIIKQYYGTGHLAQLVYEQDRRQQEVREREQATRKHIKDLDVETDTLNHTTRTLTKIYLLLAGYYQHHRGEWRKRRRQIIQQGDFMVSNIQVQEKLSIDGFESLMQRILTGDETLVPAIKAMLDDSPVVWQEALSLTKKVETVWVQTIAKDLISREAIERQVSALKMALQAESSSPLEFLLVGTICTTWLAYMHAELTSAEQLQQYGHPLTQAQENHLTYCQKRYFLAIRELARIRQLLKPRTTTVINVADQQQVNVT